MFANSLDKKPIVKRSDGLEIKDLTSSMFDVKSNNYITYNVYRVPKEFAMRPDLIAASVYNDSEYAEIILKYNGISNPFSINEGDIILIPNLSSATANISTQKGTQTDGGKLIRDSYKYLDPIKIPKINTSFQNRQIVSNAPDGALPPNLNNEGEPQIVYRNGRVYFGEGTETCLKSGMTSSEFISKVITNNATNNGKK